MKDMKILSRKNSLNGNISIPGSKSHTIRAVIFAAFTDKASVIRNPLCSDDCLTAVKIIKQLGAQVLMEDGQWLIAGRKEIFYTKDIIDVGNSGSLLYFLPKCFSKLTTTDFKTNTIPSIKNKFNVGFVSPSKNKN